MYEDHLYIQWFWFAGGPEGSEIMAWEKSPLEKCSTRCQTLLGQCNEHRFAFFGIPNFRVFCSDDAKLLQFLRGCKFSLERTKEKLDLYNSCRSKLTWMLYLIFCLEGKCKGRSDFLSGEKMTPSGPAFLTGLSRGTHRGQFSRKFSTLGESLRNLQKKL